MARFCCGLARRGLSVLYVRHPRLGSDVYVVGTNHVSARSREEVATTIARVRPRVVVVELCERRAGKFSVGAATEQPLWVRVLVDGVLARTGLRMAGLREALLEVLGLVENQGGDMREAMRAAKDVGADVVLGDVDCNETWRKLAAARPPTMSALWEAAAPLIKSEALAVVEDALRAARDASTVDEAVDRMTDVVEDDLNTARRLPEALETLSPACYDVLVHQRDRHLAARLRTAARDAHGEAVVAVVGLAHVRGLRRHFLDDDDDDPRSLFATRRKEKTD
mmetsp:Transcript_25144/g.81305  ORF Transcript_25144/g.81305 Transcript_25144/m.81305 type:complete len:281 (+) Transcript_25144:380-1222(+)